MRIRNRLTGLAGVSTLLVALGAVSAPASADVWYGADGDHPDMVSGDVSRLRVEHAPRRVEAKVRFHDYGYGDRLLVFYDTRPRDAGPELALDVTIIAEAGLVDRWELRRIDSFREGLRGEGTPVRCRGDQASLTAQAGVYTEVPRRCLASRGAAPRKVRVGVWSWAHDHGPAGESWHDWAPGPQRFGPSVRVG